ncbi:MAG TPA: serine hydrolase domain-containing protein [Xanthobacteraceae bacterium]|nr:serine hydrolase domain-containing protein [Xanthobacteraceae bacterium]
MNARYAALLAGVLITAAPLGAPAHAQVAAHPSATVFNTSFRAWMTQFEVPSASLAIMKDGHLTATFGAGGMDAAAPAAIASLSKAITGACIAQIVDSGRLSFNAPLGSVLVRTFARLGQPADPRFKAITIEQLLMHRAGLAREPKGGPVARDMAGRFVNILATPLADDPGGAMVYSNIGYATLGMVVEAVTGSPYERYCRAAVLQPMKVAGTIDPRLQSRASSGGWRVSAIDYARFIQVLDPVSPGLGPLARQWQAARNSEGAYGLGIFARRTPQGIVLNHSGRNALPERGGSFVIKFPNGWTAVAMFAGDPRGGVADLRQRLQTAFAGL